MATRSKIVPDVPAITTSHIALVDQQGRLRGELTAHRMDNGDPSLVLRDSKERERIQVQIDGVHARVVILNENGTSALGFGIDPSAGNSIALYDQNGHIVCQISVGTNGERHIQIMDQSDTVIHDRKF